MSHPSADDPTETSEIWYRPAIAADLPAIERLSDEVQSLHATARPDIFKQQADRQGRRAFFEKAMAEAHWHLCVAGSGPQVLGYAMGEWFRKEPGPIRKGYTEAHIHQICVDPTAWRCGLGSGLLSHLLEALRAREPDRITVATWAFNTASRGFFTARGFAPVMITAELQPQDGELPGSPRQSPARL